MKIRAWAVGNRGCEHNMVYNYYFFKRKALRRYEEIRLDLLSQAKAGRKFNKKNGNYGDDMYSRMIKNLKEKDPEKMDNYPHDEPYIHRVELEFF